MQNTLRDDARFSNAFPQSPQLLEAFGSHALPAPSRLGSDGAEHSRQRGLVGKAFTPRIVWRLEARMHSLAHEFVDAAVAQGTAELVQALSYLLPVTVIAEMIGIPAADRSKFKDWSDRLVASLGLVFLGAFDKERFLKQRALQEEMRAYLIPLAEQRKREPREDLMTGLALAEHEGSRLSHDEMLQILILLLVAGNETTTTLIQNLLLELLANPEWERRVRADRALAPLVIEETLRHSSPVQFAPRRAARSRRAGCTVEIRPDDFLLCWIGAANRDAKVFDDAERFDPLLAKTSRIEAAWTGDLPLHPSPVFGGVTQLPVRLTPA